MHSPPGSHSPLSEHSTNRNSAATLFTSVSRCVMRRTSLFRSCFPTSGRVFTSLSGGSTWGGRCPSALPGVVRVSGASPPPPAVPGPSGTSWRGGAGGHTQSARSARGPRSPSACVSAERSLSGRLCQLLTNGQGATCATWSQQEAVRTRPHCSQPASQARGREPGAGSGCLRCFKTVLEPDP